MLTPIWAFAVTLAFVLAVVAVGLGDWGGAALLGSALVAYLLVEAWDA